jgi:DNA-binding protein H-NS
MSKPTLGELIAQKAALEQQIAELQHTQRAEAIAQIRALMNEYGLTLTDIGARSPAAQQAAARADGRGTGKVAPKYRDPGSGQTWSGRGLQPRWLREAMAAGRTLSDFAIGETK